MAQRSLKVHLPPPSRLRTASAKALPGIITTKMAAAAAMAVMSDKRPPAHQGLSQRQEILRQRKQQAPAMTRKLGGTLAVLHCLLQKQRMAILKQRVQEEVQETGACSPVQAQSSWFYPEESACRVTAGSLVQDWQHQTLQSLSSSRCAHASFLPAQL